MTIIIALLLFGVIVFIHELGHFLLARKAGIKIHEFAIGMGPKLFSIKKDVIYSVRLLPLGGYVSMEGEDGESNDPRSFGQKSILQRASVLFAGPFFNIVLAIILLIPVGMYLGLPSNSTKIGEVIKDTPAYIAGLESGDSIKKIDGENVSTWKEISEKFSKIKDKEVEMSIDRDGKEEKIKITPELSEDGRYVIGIQQVVEKSFGKSVINAFTMTGSMIYAMLQFIVQLITGTVPGGAANAVAGPIGVINMASTAAKQGAINLLYFASIISLNLGILNLLPIPALDGGRLFMLFIEFIRGGKKVDPNKEAVLNLVGFGALMCLMLFTTYKDIMRIFIK